MGSVMNGRYQHATTGTSFLVPAGWTVLRSGPSSDGGEMVSLKDTVSDAVVSVWMIVTNTSQEGIAAEGPEDWNRHHIGMKIRQRFDQGLRDYWVRADTIQNKVIGGLPALAARGEFTQNTERIVECLTWIHGKTARAFFFARAPESRAELLQIRFDELVGTALIP
jgi:hypothetical protein